MTKIRAPLTFEQAIARIAGHLGWEEAAKMIGKKERTLRDYGDPDHDAQISLENALILDAAYVAAGGEGRPIEQCYSLRLDAEAAASGHDDEAQARLVAEAASETGDALAALIAAIRPGATPADKALARRETEQAVNSLTNTLPMLEAAGASSDGVRPRGGAST